MTETPRDEQQSTALGLIKQTWQTHPSRGITPEKLARILTTAEEGNLSDQAELFMDMEEKDAHIYAEMAKRKKSLLSIKWDVIPGKSGQNIADSCKAILQGIEFEDLLLDMADGIGHGFACLEIKWAKDNAEWFPERIEHRPQNWFTVDRDTKTELRLLDPKNRNGAKLWKFGWIVHIHRAKSGYLSRAGLHRILAWPYLYKNYSVRDLAEFLEIYGVPMRKGKYSGNDTTQKSALTKILKGMGHAPWAILPDGTDIEFLTAAAGSSDVFDTMIDWAERSQSKAILGATLTTQADRSSNTNALGRIHDDVRKDIRDADAMQIQRAITKELIWKLCRLNHGIQRLADCPRFEFNLDRLINGIE